MPQGPGFLTTFLYYFSTTILIVVVVTVGGMGISLESETPYQTGILLGLVAGITGAIFNRSATFSTSFRNRKAFLKKVEAILSEMGFERQTEQDEYTVYAKSPLQTMFSGKVFVQVEQNSATIVGRSNIIKKLSQIT